MENKFTELDIQFNGLLDSLEKLYNYKKALKITKPQGEQSKELAQKEVNAIYNKATQRLNRINKLLNDVIKGEL